MTFVLKEVLEATVITSIMWISNPLHQWSCFDLSFAQNSKYCGGECKDEQTTVISISLQHSLETPNM